MINRMEQRYRITGPTACALAAFLVLIATAEGYGIGTDELYFLSCARHPDLGYVDHPAFVAFITRFSLMFGTSLTVLRLFPALAFSATILAVARIVRQLGGSPRAGTLASGALLCGTAFWVMFGYVSVNAYDILFVTLAVSAAIAVLQPPQWSERWVLLGSIIGLGVNTKLTMAVFALSLAAGILFSHHRALLRTRPFWTAVLIAAAMCVPFLLWQEANGFPTLTFIRNANEKNLVLSAPALLGQLIIGTNPFLFPVWFAGIIALVAGERFRDVRPIGYASLLFFAVYLSGHSKFYYLMPLVPALLAAGVTALEPWFAARGAWIRRTIIGLPLLTGAVLLPLGVPLLSIEQFAAYRSMLGFGTEMRMEKSETGGLPGYFGQRIGWREFTGAVARVYHALPDSDKVRCGIVGFHYGEAGAVDLFGPEYGLPEAIGRHNSYWLWGPRAYTGEVLIIAVSGNTDPGRWFTSAELKERYEFPYVEGVFRVHYIYLCRGPRKPMQDLWNEWKTYD